MRLCLRAAAAAVLAVTFASANAASYTPPPSDMRALRGVDFSHAQQIAPELTQIYGECDKRQERGGCSVDPSQNTIIMKFPDAADARGPVFFDAKMAIDADGSVLSKRAERPNQPETSLRYPPPLGLSLDAEHVPYVVMPLGGFRQASGVSLGDLAAVVKDGQVHFAIVGDLGPRTKIGEASMNLHNLFGRNICRAYDQAGNCSQFLDTSLDAPVLFFFFPGTASLLMDGLSPSNINARISTLGQQVWDGFLAQGKAQRQGASGGTHAH